MSAGLDNVVRDQAKSLYIAGKAPVQIGQELDIKPDTIHKWAKRYGWQVVRQTVHANVQKVLSTHVQSELTRGSKEMRSLLAMELTGQARILSQCPPGTINELRTTPDGQGRTALVKTMADAGGIVFGWSAQDALDGAIVAGDLQKMESLDVEAVTPDPEKPAI